MTAVANQRPVIAVVGATGAVGKVMLEVLTSRAASGVGDVYGGARLIASPRSAGRKLSVFGREETVVALSPEAFDGVDIALFDVPDEVSAEWAPIAAARGVVVIDKSGAFRMDPQVPLVVPEVNPDAVDDRPKGIIANANCTTLAMMPILGALHREYGLTRLYAASYQAASGAGQAGIDDLYAQYAAAAAAGNTVGQTAGDVREALGPNGSEVFGAPLAMNVVPKAGGWKEDGWTSEELKVRNESRKILGIPDLPVSSTCVRVPVLIGHSLAVHATFASEVDAAQARKILAAAPGVVVQDDPANGVYPMPIDAVGTDPVYVGRIRKALDDPYSLDMFVVGDNLLKGAALNSAQIAELVVARGL